MEAVKLGERCWLGLEWSCLGLKAGSDLVYVLEAECTEFADGINERMRKS